MKIICYTRTSHTSDGKYISIVQHRIIIHIAKVLFGDSEFTPRIILYELPYNFSILFIVFHPYLI